MRWHKILFFSFLLALLSFSNTSFAANTVDTELSQDRVTIGEALLLSFTLHGNSHGFTPDFSALEKDFHIESTNYGSAFSMVNGTSDSKTFWRLTLVPKRTGDLIIPEIDFDGIKSTVRNIVVAEAASQVAASPVQAAQAAQTSQAPQSQDAAPLFVQAEVSTTSPYVQSEVLYKFKLFYRMQIENPMIELPTVKDATMVQLGDVIYSQATVNGKAYLVIEKNFAIFPQKLGTINIAPTHFSAMVIEDNGAMSNDPYYMGVAPKTVTVATKAFDLNVKAIPANYPLTTWLPATNVSLSEKWSVEPGQWQAGNPVTRTVSVNATGLRADQIPDLSFEKIAGVTIYVDPPKRTNDFKNNEMSATVEQKVTYIPDGSRSFSIPAVKLNWWDLTKNANAVTELNSITVQVSGKINSQTAGNTTGADNKPAAAIPTALSAPEAQAKPFYTSTWFWLATFFAAAWLITIGFFWKKRSGKNNPAVAIPERDKLAHEISSAPSDESFARACEQGNAVLAQQYLLSWAKNQGQDSALNLEKLRDNSSDVNFKIALDNLQQAIYAKSISSWDGRALLAAFRQQKKKKKIFVSKLKNKNSQTPNNDPLPPLNP